MADKTLATFRIDPDLWEQFKTQAANNGTNASAALIKFCRDYANGVYIQSSRQSLDEIEASIYTNSENLDERIDKRVLDAVADARTDLTRQTNHLLSEIQERIARLETDQVGKLSA